MSGHGHKKGQITHRLIKIPPEIPKDTLADQITRANLQNGGGRSQIWSGFSRLSMVASYVSRRFPRFHLKNRRTLTLFTSMPQQRCQPNNKSGSQNTSKAERWNLGMSHFGHIAVPTVGKPLFPACQCSALFKLSREGAARCSLTCPAFAKNIFTPHEMASWRISASVVLTLAEAF